MSFARFSYMNTATIRPFVSIDMVTGQSVYGEEYEIACNWEAGGKQERDSGGDSGARGAEFISIHTIYCEDIRPQYLDLVQLSGHADWEEIRSKTEWDMAWMDDTNDFKLVTG